MVGKNTGMKNLKIFFLILVIIILTQIFLPMWEFCSTSISMAIGNEVYNIYTAQDLWDFAQLVNNGDTFKDVTVYLTSDIDLGCSESKQWVPIGKYNANEKSGFNGIFDGQNHIIRGIYIGIEEEYQGLFGYNRGVIKNITIDSINTNYNESFQTGAIAGYNSGEIIDCVNKSLINGGSYCGGICGINNGDIISCINKGQIMGDGEITGKRVGGICGYNGDGGNIKNSINEANIQGNEELGTGGIVGFNNGIIESCTNKAKVGSKWSIGGIVGQNANTIINCNNEGEIAGNGEIGGIAGTNDYRSNARKVCNDF